MVRRYRLRSLAAAAVLLAVGQGVAALGGKASPAPIEPDSSATATSQVPTGGPGGADSAAVRPGGADSAAVRPGGDAAAGKKLFTSRGCVACHKADGSGGIKLTGKPTPDWRDATRLSDPALGDEYLRDCITNGKPESGMIPWKEQIKPEQIDDLIACIKTFGAKKKGKK